MASDSDEYSIPFEDDIDYDEVEEMEEEMEDLTISDDDDFEEVDEEGNVNPINKNLYEEELEFETNSEPEPEEIKDEILTLNDVPSVIVKYISDIREIIEVPDGIIRILLQKFKWDKDPLLERFYEADDLYDFLRKQKIDPFTSSQWSGTEGECEICCETFLLTGPSCNHKACPTCWKFYISERIKEGNSEIECMASKCELLLPDEQVLEYFNDKSELDAYLGQVINSFVQFNAQMRWCPGVDCGRIVKSSSTDPHDVSCQCGTQFCFSCGNDGHSPVNCRHLKLWLKKCLDDSETANWINANTKDCPKCLVPIEKNGGCNYIRCRNPTCRHTFCWICMKDWAIHTLGHFRCNIFVSPEETAAAELARGQSRSFLQRYLFYFSRYQTHKHSLSLEKKLIEKMNKKIEEAQEYAMSWNDAQFLRDAVDSLSKSRRTMMYTYVFAFYLKRNNHAEIFETNQRDLEMATEQLSGYLEQDMDEEDPKTLKQKVQDKCRYIEHRRKVLMNHCSEGNEQEIWEFTQ
ncbi:hypothetical protein B9Z55_003047 [Caenorhabditis nigoni]|uniref:RBR-type E3 ubiquitin transferase n=1 Tax=Caenorhabditis nigoni TaxID=1611254 RepID=A0A2G5VN71_9PELO|nr:hypothetical protein B9Z55_003047 [Caenorhabditis nigoni]